MTLPDEEAGLGPRKPFLEHLEDLRRAIIRSLSALALGMAVAIPLAPHVVTVLKEPLRRAGVDPDSLVRVIEISGGFAVAMKVILWTGVLLSAPLILFFVGGFVFPALTASERRIALRCSGVAAALFAIGAWMGYAIALPQAISLMLGVGDWIGVQTEFITLGNYITFALQLLAAFGLAFELPLVVLVLGYIGILSSRQLRDKRRHMIVMLLIIATLLTPPDVFSQLLMAIPLVALYEISVWLVWAKERATRGAPASPVQR